MIDEKLRMLLQDIGRALASAMADSAEMSDSLAQLRKEGYVLFLGRVKPGSFDDLEAAVEPSMGPSMDPSLSLPAPGARRTSPRRAEPEPEFRINSRDLHFLQSIGIDPTRKIRRRRGR